MKTWKCQEMMCDNCVSRIHKALEAASIPHQVNLEAKTVTAEGDGPKYSQAVEILEDLGFNPMEI